MDTSLSRTALFFTVALKVARCDNVQRDSNHVQCDGNNVQCVGNDVQCDDKDVQCDSLRGLGNMTITMPW